MKKIKRIEKVKSRVALVEDLVRNHLQPKIVASIDIRVKNGEAIIVGDVDLDVWDDYAHMVESVWTESVAFYSPHYPNASDRRMDFGMLTVEAELVFSRYGTSHMLSYASDELWEKISELTDKGTYSNDEIAKIATSVSDDYTAKLRKEIEWDVCDDELHFPVREAVVEKTLNGLTYWDGSDDDDDDWDEDDED